MQNTFSIILVMVPIKTKQTFPQCGCPPIDLTALERPSELSRNPATLGYYLDYCALWVQIPYLPYVTLLMYMLDSSSMDFFFVLSSHAFLLRLLDWICYWTAWYLSVLDTQLLVMVWVQSWVKVQMHTNTDIDTGCARSNRKKKNKNAMGVSACMAYRRCTGNRSEREKIHQLELDKRACFFPITYTVSSVAENRKERKTNYPNTRENCPQT